MVLSTQGGCALKKIYIAGAYSADNILEILANIKKGQDMAAYLIAHGYAVFCPFLDWQPGLTVYGNDLTKEQYQANSMAFVEVCDAILVLKGWEQSGGTKREIKRAQELDIPVYYDRAKMMGEVK